MRVLGVSALFSVLTRTAAYCNWNNCNGEVQGDPYWCGTNAHFCMSCGAHTGAKWCGDYCASDSSCNGEVFGDSSCSDTPGACSGCGGHWCTGGEASSLALPTSGVASTTRYWDCSGGACGCAYVPGPSNDPSHCYSNALFAAPPGNPYGAAFYGTAAVSETLGGADWMSPHCGKCWKVTGSSITGVSTTLVLRAANFCPPENAACNGKAHFDIAAPGFDYAPYSLSNTCSVVEPGEKDGFESCGNWMITSQNPAENCNCALFNDPVLRAGCENFLSLQWDNPEVAYELVACPDEMVTECSHPYPPIGTMPATCASPNTQPTAPTAATPAPAAAPVTPAPAAAPVTPAPVSPAPVTPAPVSSGNECCTSNFGTCDISGWCQESEANCNVCDNVVWTAVPMPGCIALWGECTNDQNGCCDHPDKATHCVYVNQWYSQCRPL